MVLFMSTMLQIRNVPEDLHRRLKATAALEGVSMSEYAMDAIRRALERPSRQELIERLRARPRRALRPSPTELLREERERR